MKSSRIPGFYRLPPAERLARVQAFASLSDEQAPAFGDQGLSLDRAELMIENVVGRLAMPLGVGLNFLIPVITVNSYAPAFAVGAALAILTVVSVFVLCPNIKPLKPKSTSQAIS